MRGSGGFLHAALLIAACELSGAAASAQAPPADPQCSASRLIGTWERISLLRNGLSVQPPDAPLFVKFGSDGYWSMMEMPDRPKVDKPLDQQTAKELWSRFDRVEGGQGTWTVKTDGSVVTRRHLVNVAPGGEGTNQDRSCVFEADILALIGTGANRSPQARFKRLPAQQVTSHALVGTWERTSLTLDGKAQPAAARQVVILGEDGWFSQTELPTGRKSPGKPMEQYTQEDYLQSFSGVSASRGTYTVDTTTLRRKHVANIDPNLIGRDETAEFKLSDDVLTLRGTTAAGVGYEATLKRLPKLETTGK